MTLLLHMRNQKVIIVLFLIILLGTALRMYRLDANDLWYDEAVSVRIVENYSSSSPQPPLYYALLSLWIRVFGRGEAALRSLSVLFGVISIFWIYTLASLFVDRKTGLISAFLLAISPLHIWYAQEVREYTLLPCFIMAIVYFFVRAVKEDKSWLWISFALSAILGLYVSYFTFWVILAGIPFLFFRREKVPVRKWLISYLVILPVFSPWFKEAFSHLNWVKDAFWLSTPVPRSLLATFENFTLGYNAPNHAYLPGSILCTLLFIGGIFYCRRRAQNVSFLLVFLFAPVFASFFFSQWIPIYLDRQNMAVSPFYYIIVASGVTGIGAYGVRFLLGAGVVLLTVVSLSNYYTGFMPLGYGNRHSVGVCPKKDFVSVAGYLKRKLEKNDIIAHTHPSSVPSLWYYFGCRDPVGSYYFTFYSEQDTYWRKEIRSWEERERQDGIVPPGVIDLSRDIEKYNFERIWLISSSWFRTGVLEPNSLAVKEWLGKKYRKLESREFDGLFVELYEKCDMFSPENLGAGRHAQ